MSVSCHSVVILFDCKKQRHVKDMSTKEEKKMFIKKLFATVILSLAMVAAVVPASQVKAEDGFLNVNLETGDFVVAEGSTESYDSLYVLPGMDLVVKGTVKFDHTVILKKNAYLIIDGKGSLEAIDIIAEDGAWLELGDASNLPKLKEEMKTSLPNGWITGLYKYNEANKTWDFNTGNGEDVVVGTITDVKVTRTSEDTAEGTMEVVTVTGLDAERNRVKLYSTSPVRSADVSSNTVEVAKKHVYVIEAGKKIVVINKQTRKTTTKKAKIGSAPVIKFNGGKMYAISYYGDTMFKLDAKGNTIWKTSVKSTGAKNATKISVKGNVVTVKFAGETGTKTVKFNDKTGKIIK